MPGALALVFETSTPRASLALADAESIRKELGFCSDRNHNAMLFQPLSELIQEAGKQNIGLVLVGSGPGSYSGTRVGIAAAQGVAIALGCPAVAVPSILAVPAAENGSPCLAIGDARRGSYWTARIENSILVTEPELCDAQELQATVLRTVTDDVPVFSFEEPGRFPLTEELTAKVVLETPDATRLWKAWAETSEKTRLAWSASIPQPIYLKPPHITPSKRPSLLRP